MKIAALEALADAAELSLCDSGTGSCRLMWAAKRAVPYLREVIADLRRKEARARRRRLSLRRLAG